MILSQQDINVYLQLSGCCYSSMCNNLHEDLKYGKKCLPEDRTNLGILSILIEILECYDVNSLVNCLSDSEIKDVISKISQLTGICFKPTGFEYIKN